jgi:hypothetical protein
MVGGVVAHSDFPPKCSILGASPLPLHFDDSENVWCIGAVADALDVETVALHEIGHILGLQHTNVDGAVMFPFVSANTTLRRLQPDDLAGIRSLYPSLLAIGKPSGYLGGTSRTIYRGDDGHIHEIAIYPETGSWGHFDMTAATGAPLAASDPMGYLGDVSRVVYRGQDNHIHEIAIYPDSGNWGHFDMTAATGAPPAASTPMGYLGGVPRVVYRGTDAHLHEVAIHPENGSWAHFDLTAGGA